MGQVASGCVGIAMAALSLSACAGTRAVDEEPKLRFVQSRADAADSNREAPARVRRDGHGRPVYFREQRLDNHGVMRDVVPRDADDARGEGASGCGDRADCAADDGRR
ncbi:hypothetical protein GCM10022229_04640 [Luteimonas lutimaris]|uniref:Lipoprotein n=1 Tax=Luteimonas lutimaris TaxID=698645 RepID=A0ABP7M5E8_9GAMM